MSTRTDKATEAAGDKLPAYSEAPPYTEAAEPEASSSSGVPPPPAAAAAPPPPPPPDYRQASFTPYVPIPPMLHGVSKTAYRGFHLCADADGHSRLFYAAHHTGVSGTGPLGGRQGVYLHNGLDAGAPVLAAAGQRLQHESLRERTSVVLLPPHMPADDGGSVSAGHTDTLMEPSDDGGDDDVDGSLVFRLRLDIGTGPANKLRPAKFAWCRLGGGDSSSGEYTLVRKVFRHGEKYAAADGSSRCAYPKTEADRHAAADAGESPTLDDGEVVAVLTCGSALKPWERRLFTIELRGSAAAGLLGERCVVMIVTTAVRLYQLHAQGRTSSKFLGKTGKEDKDKKRRQKRKSGNPMGTVQGTVDAASLLGMLLR